MKVTKILLSIFLTFVILLLAIHPINAKSKTQKIAPKYHTEYVMLPGTFSADIAKSVVYEYIKIGECPGAEIYHRMDTNIENDEGTAETDAVVIDVTEYETRTTHNTEEIDKDFLAKLLYAEAGSTTFECQVWVCSAILNLCEYKDVSLWSAGHNPNIFSVAYKVDYVKPSSTCYEVIDYVFNGNRIADICYFRKDHYHKFGVSVDVIDGVYFSKP